VTEGLQEFFAHFCIITPHVLPLLLSWKLWSFFSPLPHGSTLCELPNHNCCLNVFSYIKKKSTELLVKSEHVQQEVL